MNWPKYQQQRQRYMTKQNFFGSATIILTFCIKITLISGFVFCSSSLVELPEIVKNCSQLKKIKWNDNWKWNNWKGNIIIEIIIMESPKMLNAGNLTSTKVSLSRPALRHQTRSGVSLCGLNTIIPSNHTFRFPAHRPCVSSWCKNLPSSKESAPQAKRAVVHDCVRAQGEKREINL